MNLIGHSGKVFNMKRLLLILILTLSFQSLIKAEDIRDFEIEGISIGNSLLNYLSEKEIKVLSISPYTFRYPNNSYITLTTPNPGYEIYNRVSVVLKVNDKNYIIKALEGMFSYGDKIHKCYEKQKIISQDIETAFRDKFDKDEWNGKYGSDKSGKSKVKYIDYEFTEGSAIRIICYDMDKDFIDPNDQLTVAINSIEFMKYLMNR